MIGLTIVPDVHPNAEELIDVIAEIELVNRLEDDPESVLMIGTDPRVVLLCALLTR